MIVLVNNDSKRALRVPLIVLALVWSLGAWGASGLPHHRLEVWLQPGRLVVEDRIEFDAIPPDGEVVFRLGSPLRIENSDAEIVSTGREDQSDLRSYRIRLAAGSTTLNLRYSGRLTTPPGADSSPAMPHVVYDGGGVYLDGESGWYPRLRAPLATFSLTVRHPEQWQVVSQGAGRFTRPGLSTWEAGAPQDDIYLIAGPYQRYQRAGRIAEAQVFLRSPDEELAQRYLNVTERFLDLYSRLLGPYPFPKFAVVENRWQTGFGMPSFTLLGSRVMRLPFILTSSYPHEIVHNWLGNSVFPDYRTGNWSEGLTTYLADHLLQEQQGGGARYRRGTLQKYADYVSGEEDFPLRAFRSRHNGASQAVGYGKTLMLFHMLRRRLGDTAFRQGLRELVEEYRLKTTGFDAVRRVFERVGGTPLEAFFSQWVERTGAPELDIADVMVTPLQEGGYRVGGELRQTQAGNPYRLDVPLALTVAGRSEARLTTVTMTTRRAPFSIDLKERPVRLDVDPRFDLFRKLSSAELPPSLGQIFGDSRMYLVLPSDAPAELLNAYRALAKEWRLRFPGLRLRSDREALPDSGGIWLLGANNRHAEVFVDRLREHYGVRDPRVARLTEEPDGVDPTLRSVVLTVRRSDRTTLGWIVPNRYQAIPLLARKLPHYGRYSYLTFSGDEVRNVVKAELPVVESPLTRSLVPGSSPPPMGHLPSEIPLIR